MSKLKRFIQAKRFDSIKDWQKWSVSPLSWWTVHTLPPEFCFYFPLPSFAQPMPCVGSCSHFLRIGRDFIRGRTESLFSRWRSTCWNVTNIISCFSPPFFFLKGNLMLSSRVASQKEADSVACGWPAVRVLGPGHSQPLAPVDFGFPAPLGKIHSEFSLQFSFFASPYSLELINFFLRASYL